MDLDHWKQLDSLLQSVLERPLEERDAFLRHACAGDEPLERRVRALLSAEPDARHFMERPAIELAALSLASEQDGKAVLLVAVTKDLTGKLKAGDLVKEAAKLVGGAGGGKPDIAQAGGSDPAGIEKALAKVKELATAALG